MRNLLPILAIPILLVGRPASMVHCHSGNERPHVHLDDIDHAKHHGAGSEESRAERPVSHDDDAVYISDEPATVAPAKTGVDPVMIVGFCTVCDLQHVAGSSDLHCRFHPPPVASDSDCPRFIRQLSLLI